jgi:hypothetical protein
MNEFLIVALVVIFFAISVGLVALCERLMEAVAS